MLGRHEVQGRPGRWLRRRCVGRWRSGGCLDSASGSFRLNAAQRRLNEALVRWAASGRRSLKRLTPRRRHGVEVNRTRIIHVGRIADPLRCFRGARSLSCCDAADRRFNQALVRWAASGRRSLKRLTPRRRHGVEVNRARSIRVGRIADPLRCFRGARSLSCCDAAQRRLNEALVRWAASGRRSLKRLPPRRRHGVEVNRARSIRVGRVADPLRCFRGARSPSCSDAADRRFNQVFVRFSGHARLSRPPARGWATPA